MVLPVVHVSMLFQGRQRGVREGFVSSHLKRQHIFWEGGEENGMKGINLP